MAIELKSLGRARLIAGGLVVATVAGVIGYRSLGSSAEAATPTPSTTVAPTTTTTAPNPMDPVVKEVQVFVENTRSHKFLRPVKVTLADDATFKSRYLSGEQPDKAEVEKVTGELRALGFVPAGFDLLKAHEEDGWKSVVGFYDPDTKDLVVRGGRVSPYVKGVLAHELTHALDDQLFGLNKADIYAAHDERGDSFKALVEGDAVHVQRAYWDAMSPPDRASAEAEESGYGSQPRGAQAAPPALGFFGIYPYVFGSEFVDALVKKNGQAAVDKAFAVPPVSSAQIINPDRYIVSSKYGVSMPGASAHITEPEADKDKVIIDHGVIGQFGLYVMLRQTMGDDLALLAATIWEGDRYVAWKDGDKTCVRARFLTESTPATYPLAVLLKMWVSRQGGGTVEAPGTVILTTCR